MISLTSPVETRAHGWPAGVKLAALCAATVVLFAIGSPVWQAVILGLVLLAYALPGLVFLRSGLGRLWGLWPFVLLILVWHAVIGDVPGGAVIVMRMLSAVALANLVTMTTTLSALQAVLHRLLGPLRALGLPTRGVEIAMVLVIRFVPVLVQNGQQVLWAWRARSPRRPGWRVIVPMIVTAIDDAEQVGDALRARGGL